MKDTCTSTALVGAIAGTTVKTLEMIYDAPTWRRQQGLAARAFTPVAAALHPAALVAADPPPPRRPNSARSAAKLAARSGGLVALGGGGEIARARAAPPLQMPPKSKATLCSSHLT